MRALALALALFLPLVAPVGARGAAAPLPRAHAHNDYEHARPLLDALEHGFTSVEADVWLVDGKLLVAHDARDLRPDRTLQALYLDPLAARVRANGGWVHPEPAPFQLLIDIKSEGGPTYRALAGVLEGYAAMLTTVRDGRVTPGPVTAVVSGDRPRELMEGEAVRRAGYDGRLPDLGQGAPATFMPLVSDNWTKTFTWNGAGPMPEAERARLRAIVAQAHTVGQRVRFWATPDAAGPEREALWRELEAAGVDHINTDDLAGLRAFLTAE
jgi:glycerophosphoryl diester phosphodiesterase